MPVSRHSFRRVFNDFVHRHQLKTEQKSNRNSIVSAESLPFSETFIDRLNQSEKELCKSLNYLQQILSHHKWEILGSLISSVIENIFDIDNVLKGIYAEQSDSFRSSLLSHVYSLLADLVDWADRLLFLHGDVDVDDQHRQIAEDLKQSVQMCISLVCDAPTRSNSFISIKNSIDDCAPALPPKRSREEKTNDEQIQLIVDDINQIIEDYTRELDDALRSKSTVHSLSADQICTHSTSLSTRSTNLIEQRQQILSPEKRQKARAYMSLFDRYDREHAQHFLRQTRFEDLFQQINVDHSLTIKNNGSASEEKLVDHHHCTSIGYHSDLFLENVSHLLVFNLDEDPPLRGGTIDALIVRATSPEKKDFLYQEAFLTTYRTFISPSDLLKKLIERYQFFAQIDSKKKLARHAFSLLIRVVDEIDHELSENLMKILSNFVTNLIRHGELQLSKFLRRKSLERFKGIQSSGEPPQPDIVLIRNSIASKRATLLDFHSSEMSEQLTLLDSELFLRIELSEILYMSIEKGEDFSPNLAAFTEHFNNISYWVRSRILEQNSQRQRENYFEKFLKILKHLRRLNNFNSYLAILSALDCGPLKRLEWSKTIIDAVSEHTDLIDSTGSFKNYREAFNSSVGQPCIPYIGLILSDLTFIHIGNSNFLQDHRVINFWKRWQQFTILHKLRYCRKWEYKFVRNDRILYFFNRFDDYMNEEAQWIQSEKIKPRQKAFLNLREKGV